MSSPATPGLGVAIGAIRAAGGGAANPNLLLWTDEVDNAIWTKENAVVTPDQNGVADEIASTSVSAAVRQVSGTAATTGAAVTADVTPSGTASFNHGEVSGTFDGTVYTFSGSFKDAGGGEPVTMRIDRSGGFLRCSLEEPIGDGDYLVKNLQLEVGPFSAYHHRGGS